MVKIAIWAAANGFLLSISYELVKNAIPGSTWYLKGLVYGSTLSIPWLLSYLEYPMHMPQLTAQKVSEAVSTITRNFLTDLVLLVISGMFIAKLFESGCTTETTTSYLGYLSASYLIRIFALAVVFVAIRLMLGTMVGCLGGVVFGLHRFVPLSLLFFYCLWSVLVGGSFTTFYILLGKQMSGNPENVRLVYAVMIFLCAGLFPNLVVRNIYLKEKYNIYPRYLYEVVVFFITGLILTKHI